MSRRTNKNGEIHAHSLNTQDYPMEYWRGEQPQTLAFYRRIIATVLADIEFRKQDYARHFDMKLLADAIGKLDELQAYLEELNGA